MENIITNEWLEEKFGGDYDEVVRTSCKWEWEKNLEDLWYEIYTTIVEDWLYRDMTAEESTVLDNWLDSK